LACHLQIDADPDRVPDPTYYFDADPDADPDPGFLLNGSGLIDLNFYLMRIQIRMRIHVTKMMRNWIQIHNNVSQYSLNPDEDLNLLLISLSL
jgi:hypothetical protein